MGGLAFDSSGNLWVSDNSNNRVLEFRPPFSMGMNASLVIGQPDFETGRASISQSGFLNGLATLVIDPSGNIWVGDKSRVLEFRAPFSTGMNA